MKKEQNIQEVKFDGFKQGNLPQNAHGEFNHDVLTKAKATPDIVTNLPNQLASYEAAVAKETMASFKDLSESLTEQINNVLVPNRDKVETGMKAGFRAQMESDDPEVVEDATTLFELAHLHRVHTDMKVDAQTDAIRDFIADVEANHMAALTRTGCTALFNKLKAANDAVCDAMMQRMEIDALRVHGAMAAARKATDEAYHELLRGITAYAYVQGAEGYLPFSIFVNQLIKHYKRIYPNTNTSSGSSSGSTSGGVEEEVTEEETEEEEVTTPTKYTLTFIHNGQTVETKQLEAGAAITAPAAPTGYHWVNVPSVMPAENLTIHSEEDEEEEPPILS